MSKRRKGEDMSSEELLSISNEFSANTKNKLDTAFGGIMDILNKPMSDSESDSDEEQSPCNSSASNVSIDDAGKQLPLVAGNDKREIGPEKGEISKETMNSKKEDTIDSNSIPLFQAATMESTDIPTELKDFFKVDRNELFLQLQHDLLLKWFQYQKKKFPHYKFPPMVARNLYRMVYSSDPILSAKASETLSMLYQEFTTKQYIVWAPSYSELQQGLKFLSGQQETCAGLEHRATLLLSWCRVINAFFQALRALWNGCIGTANAVSLYSRLSIKLTLREMILFWRDLMTISIQAQVVNAKLEGEVLKVSQSVLRAAFTEVCCCKQVSSSRGGSNVCDEGSSFSLQALESELQEAIREMWSSTDAIYQNKGCERSSTEFSSHHSECMKKRQLLIDHVDLLSTFRNIEIVEYISFANHDVLSKQNQQALYESILAVQITCIESILMRLFGNNCRDICEQQRSNEGHNEVTLITSYQQSAWEGTNLGYLLDSTLSTSGGQSHLLLFSHHYLLQSCSLLKTLYSKTMNHGKGEQGEQANKSSGIELSFDKDTELIYVLFKLVNILFNVTVESAFLISRKSLVEVSTDSMPLSVSGKKRTLSTLSEGEESIPASNLNTHAVKVTCESFVDNTNNFKSILRKKQCFMGSMMEIAHIIRSINDKWDLVKEYYIDAR